jgi:hypothetical protein
MNQQQISKSDLDALKQYILSVDKKLDKLISLIENNSQLPHIQNNTPKISPTGSTKKISIKTSKNDTQSSSAPIKRGHAIINVFDDIILITGETYDRRELIKSWSGKWNAAHKGWSVPVDRLNDVQEASQKYFNNVQITKNQGSLLNMSPSPSTNSNQNIKNVSIQPKQVNKSKLIERICINDDSDEDCQIDSDYD